MSDDPTKDAWDAVGDQAKDLGEAFKGHYDDSEDVAASDEVKDALKQVGDGLERLFSAVGAAIRDPEVKDKAKATGTSFLDAVGQTLTTVAGEVRTAFEQRTGGASVDAEVDLDGESGDEAMDDAHRELDDADAVEEIRADLEDADDEGDEQSDDEYQDLPKE